MPTRQSASGSELFIVDNSDADGKAIRYLRDWCQLSKGFDIATGYFEIGSLLALEGEWRKVDKIRILMGDEVSRRTQKAFADGLSGIAARLDGSLETEKDKNDFLDGVPAIVAALRSKKIECRVYRQDKFHAKAYITHARLDVVGSAALVGSSNMTRPGLTENIELNVQITGAPVKVLQEWYEEHWERAEDVTPDILRVMERHVREYSPFEVYAKALQEFFRGHELTASEWEREKSVMYRVLAPYQREGYHGLLKKAGEFRGAFLCDGVGLGKTFVGMMLIERFVVHDRLNVALFVPKSTREDVWERDLKKYLPELRGPFGNRLEIYNHTDLLRGGKYPVELEAIRKKADVIIVDEAHHFRNTGTRGGEGEPRKSQYWKLFDVTEGKKLFMLTATPINNRLTDLQHMIELFTHKEQDYFKTLGIHSLPGHFRKIEKALEKAVAAKRVKGNETETEAETDLAEAQEVLQNDDLFGRLVVQRSRAYVKKSLKAEGEKEILFPKPRDPKVVPYSVKQTYGKILKKIEDAFNKDVQGDVMAEARGREEDNQLKEAYRLFYANGTRWFDRENVQRTLTSKEIKLKTKNADIAGLQLADVLAYPVKQSMLIERQLIEDTGDNFGKRVFEAVKDKLNRNKGKVDGYGKVWL
jgi:hypothetical protein